MYGKIFPSLWTGSMMGVGSTTQNLMQFAVSNCNQDGEVEINPDLLTHLFGDPRDAIVRALDYLCRPDPQSRSPDEEGRRLVREGQFLYRIVNYRKYRNTRDLETRREQTREAVKRYRDKQKNDVSNVSQCKSDVSNVSHASQCKPKQKHKQKHISIPPHASACTPSQGANPSAKAKKFNPPTLEEVSDYAQSINFPINAEKFIDHYTANGWMRGKTQIRDWKACVRTWRNNEQEHAGRRETEFDAASAIGTTISNEG